MNESDQALQRRPAALGKAAVARAVGAIVLGAAMALLLQGCSTVKLAYNQAPQLMAWQINRYLGLSDAQSERVRDELDDLHQWHRDTMLPLHAQVLQKVQRQLADDVTAQQACSTYADIRTQLDQVVSQAEPKMLWLASQLTDSQIRQLERKQADSNADWRKEWLDPTPEKLREHRFKELLSRAEGFYGRLDEPQKAALREFIARSSFNPERVYNERLRRQKDLVQVLQAIARDRQNTAQAKKLLREYLARFDQSPDPAYRSYAQTLVSEGCAGFAQVHNATTPSQRLKAVASARSYEQDFMTLAAQ
ncbi:DUF6279 family lipoprotein [Acidovorax sp. sic0104]|uniref:DUF6279 family lipoprotein n=1 Tax=Acidovorax sp. sic0104 TaxID=2854784 RepID=UPI0030DBD664